MFKFLSIITIPIVIVMMSIIFNPNVGLCITIDPKNTDAQHLEYGLQHECVLPIYGFYEGPNGNIPYTGSCVLIDENHFLTAAHILYASLEHQVIFEQQKHDCIYITVHHQFVPNKKNGFYDIAIGKLSKPIKLNFYPELYNQSDEIGKISSQAGYGFPGNFIKGYDKTITNNIRRAGSNIISQINNHLLICRNNDMPHTSLESLITPGDSGGGLFIDSKLAGIHSCVFSTDGTTDSDYGDESGHTRISNYIEWINNNKNLDLKAAK